MKLHHLVRLNKYIAHLIDKGEAYSVEDVLGIVVNGNVIEWLSENYSYIDFEVYEGPISQEICTEIKNEYLGSSSSPHANGIDNNGLCYLIDLISDVIYCHYQD